MKGDYLWDGSGEPDLEVVRLERALAGARYDEKVDLPAQERPRRRRGRGLVMAALPIAAAAALLWYVRSGREPVVGDMRPDTRRIDESAVTTGSPPSSDSAALAVVPLTGSPMVGQTTLPAGGLLRPGEWLVTDGTSRARIDLRDIGEVRVGPESRVRLIGVGPNEQRLELRHGALHANVNAPPRLFLVDLPSATAVDLGCVYELVVDKKGAGTLRVATGEVSLEGHGRASLVPAGSACETRPGHGPGTPYRADAPPDLIGALRRFDFEAGGIEALDAVLAAARQADTLTLWHLIERVTGPGRARVIARLAALAPPPPGVRIGDPGALDRKGLEAWRAELQATW
jgi:ferric-dicitrate binding protein FerR (iron transport regulator)